MPKTIDMDNDHHYDLFISCMTVSDFIFLRTVVISIMSMEMIFVIDAAA